MRYWDTLAQYERDGFSIIVDKTWEDIPLDHLFDTSINPDTGLPYFDIDEMAQDIDNGNLDYFVLRARVMYDGIELAWDTLGGMLYEDARECLTDGTAEDVIWCAMEAAKKEAVRIHLALQQLCSDLELTAA